MEKIVIGAEELRKFGITVKTAREVELNVIGRKLSGALIVSCGGRCVELPPETKFERKDSEES